jgi:hypothetical protein
MSDYVHACLRFWWALVLAIAVSAAVAVAVASRHSPPTYSASLRMMVDSPSKPFLRTGVTSVTSQPAKTQLLKVPVQTANGATIKTEVVKVPQSPAIVTSKPDTEALVTAANLFPSLIESDPVASLRQKLFGAIPGSVSAKAEGAATTASGRVAPATFPIINISATAPRQAGAPQLAWSTFIAFKRWLVSNQKAGGVAKAERITVLPLVVPTTAARTDHTHDGLAAVVGLAVLAGAIFLIIVLDKAIPVRERAKVAPVAEEEEEQEYEQRAKVAPVAAVTVPPEI